MFPDKNQSKCDFHEIFYITESGNLHWGLRGVISKRDRFTSDIIETFLTERISIRDKSRRRIPKEMRVRLKSGIRFY